MSIEIQYVNRHKCIDVSHSTYMSIDIDGLYVDRNTVCRSTDYVSIEILYVARFLCSIAELLT